MHLATYLGLLHNAEETLADAYAQVGEGHAAEADVYHTCRTLRRQCLDHRDTLGPIVDRYGEHREDEPERLHAAELPGTRTGGVGLLRDLQDVYVLASLVEITWTVVGQAAQGLRDRELVEVTGRCSGETTRQLAWLRTRIKAAAPQALLVAS
jgi:hypothetical protein